MDHLLPACALRAARAFAAEGFPVYAVGGMVRNALMELVPGDCDITGPATPDEAAAIAARHGLRVKEREKHYGTLVIYDDDGSAEYTTLRDDVYVRGHRPERVIFTTDIRTDALRRDFTVNAIYYDIVGKRIVDPLGGCADIRARVLRAVTPDPARMIGDDGLRMMRMLRFCGELNMTIDPALLDAAREHAHILADIARERVWDELCKLLLSDTRYPIPHDLPRALGYMEASGVMARILPEGADVSACAGVPARLNLRLAALLRRCGAHAALSALKAPNAVMRGVSRLVQAANADPEPLSLLGLDMDEARDACLLGGEPWADVWAFVEERKPPLTLDMLRISGADVMRAAGFSGVAVGRALALLQRHAVQYPQDNARERLLALLTELPADAP